MLFTRMVPTTLGASRHCLRRSVSLANLGLSPSRFGGPKTRRHSERDPLGRGSCVRYLHLLDAVILRFLWRNVLSADKALGSWLPLGRSSLTLGKTRGSGNVIGITMSGITIVCCLR